jgi:uncharacterized protein YidB (DUF937 family)
MGLLDVIQGMENGPRGGPRPGSSSGGGMSPLTMALLGLLAFKAVKHFGANQQAPGRATQPGAVPSAGAGGGLGGMLGGLFGSGGAGSSLNEMIPGGLGGLLAGAGAGGMLSGGLGRLVEDFQNNGQGGAIKSWIGNGPNQPIEPKNLESALGADTIDKLTQHTGMDRDELLAQLSQSLPELVDHLTPNGRLPTQEEAARMV